MYNVYNNTRNSFSSQRIRSRYSRFFRRQKKAEIIPWFILIGAAFIVTVIILSYYFSTSSYLYALASEEAIVNWPQWEVQEHLIQSGETFSNALQQMGVSDPELSSIIQAAEEVYDLRTIKPDRKIQVSFNSQGGCRKVEYQIDENTFLIVNRTPDGFRAEQTQLDYQIELARAEREIDTSLYMAGVEAGLEDKVIMELTDIFAWDVDFVYETQKGDKFDILYEKRSLQGQSASPGKILAASYQSGEDIHWAVYYKDPEEKVDYYDLDGNSLRRQFLKAPLQYKYISSGYSLSRFHPVWKIYTTHQAIDYASPCGTPVSAAGAGTVTFAGWKNNVYGYAVTIRHGSIYTTRYSHLSAFARGIRSGVSVSQGQVIGYVGTTGTSTGCHLDYAMRKYGALINPLTEEFPAVEPVPEKYQDDFVATKEAVFDLWESLSK